MAATKMDFSSTAMTAPSSLKGQCGISRRITSKKWRQRRLLIRGPSGGIVLQGRVQPGAGVGPGTVHRAGRHAEGISSLGNGHPGKVTELHDLRCHRIDYLESFQRFM